MSIVIVGAGEMGYHLARQLSRERRNVILIDRHSERVSFVQNNLDVQALTGRGSLPSVLIEAGIGKADMLVAVTDSDEVNIVACAVAGHLNGFIKKIARVREIDFHEHRQILDKAHLGIDLVISPEDEAVKKLIRVLDVPGATDVMDFAEGKIKLVGIRLAPDSPLVGHSLITLRQEHPEGPFLIAAIFRESGVIIPRGSDVLKADDTVYIITAKESVDSVIRMAGIELEPLKSYMILGGTLLGIRMAQELESKGVYDIKLMESDPAKCEEIAGLLNDTMVLRSETMHEEFLRSEGISETDAFLGMTTDDEENALMALLAKRMGAKRVAAVTNKLEYDRLIHAIGVDVVVNPRLAGASRILQYIRKGKVMSVFMLPGERVEAIEFEAMQTSQLVGTPLRKIKFPAGAILGAVERGDEFIIPHGDTMILPGDRMVFFSSREAIPKVEKLASVGLDYF
ncbi:Trk system potassium transporter TrkA [Thermodesulfobacteriota bacterium]